MVISELEKRKEIAIIYFAFNVNCNYVYRW